MAVERDKLPSDQIASDREVVGEIAAQQRLGQGIGNEDGKVVNDGFSSGGQQQCWAAGEVAKEGG